MAERYKSVVVVGGSGAGLAAVNEFLALGIPAEMITVVEPNNYTGSAESSATDRDLHKQQGGGLTLRQATVQWATERGIDCRMVQTDLLRRTRAVHRIASAELVPIPNDNPWRYYGMNDPAGNNVLWKYALGDQSRWLTTWNHWQAALQARVPDGVIERAALLNIEIEQGKPVAVLSNGDRIKCDFLIGADGQNSRVRRQFAPADNPTRLGYVGFRGIVSPNQPELPLSDVVRFWHQGNSVVTTFEGNQFSFFTVEVPHAIQPGAEFNWNLFLKVPDEQQLEAIFGSKARAVAGAVQRGQLPTETEKRLREIAGDYLPWLFATLVQVTPDPYVADVRLGVGKNFTFGGGRVRIVGDAAMRLPPNSGLSYNNGLADILQVARAIAPLLLRATRSSDAEFQAALELCDAAHRVRSQEAKEQTLRPLSLSVLAQDDGTGPEGVSDPFSAFGLGAQLTS